LEVVEWVKSRLFGAGLEGEIHEYCLESGLVKKSFTSYGGAVWSMAVNPSNEVLAVGCEDGSIRLFKISDNGLEYMSLLEKQQTKVLCLRWHPYKPIIVCGGTDGCIRAVHVDTGRTLKIMRLSFSEVIIWDLLILQDGTIVSGDSKGILLFLFSFVLNSLIL
jgi:U3 small nucleolar RNA-associated protein 4